MRGSTISVLSRPGGNITSFRSTMRVSPHPQPIHPHVSYIMSMFSIVNFTKTPTSKRTHHQDLLPPVKSSLFDWDTLNTEAYYIGKGIILFTMFYCSLNWAMYRNARIKNEKEKAMKKVAKEEEKEDTDK